MRGDRRFDGDDLRRKDPKFQHPRFTQYLKAADRLGQHAWENHGKSLLAFAIRWILDRGETLTALWGARNAGQLDAVYLYVFSGRGTFWMEDESTSAEFGPGELLFFKRGTVHAQPKILEDPVFFLSNRHATPPSKGHRVRQSGGWHTRKFH